MVRLQLNYGGASDANNNSYSFVSNANTTFGGGAAPAGTNPIPYTAYHSDGDDDGPAPPPPTSSIPSFGSLRVGGGSGVGGVGNMANNNIITGSAVVKGSSTPPAGAGLPFPAAATTNTLASSFGGLGLNLGGSTSTFPAPTRTTTAIDYGNDTNNTFGGNGGASANLSGTFNNSRRFNNTLSSYRDDDSPPSNTRWGVSTDGFVPPAAPFDDDDDEGHVHLPSMPMPAQQFRRSEEGIGGGNGLVDDLNNAEEDDDGGDGVPLPPFPNPEEPVVPTKHSDQLVLKNAPIDWTEFPCSVIVSSLLYDRGAMLPAHKMLFEYHMAQSFLECLDVLCEGSYFVYYQSKSSAPKERYFRVEMGETVDGKRIPFLTWYIHKNAVAIADRVPLANLVGVTPSNRSSVFRVHMVNAQTIIGCYSGDTRSRLPASGCLTLWFWDPYYGVPRSVDILSTNPLVHKLWVMTMRGVLSVNSVTIGARRVDLDAQLLEVQRALDEELAEATEEARLRERRAKGGM